MKAFYAGSFNPFTIGHLSIARRALEIFDELIIGVGVNKSKCDSSCYDSRMEIIKKSFEGESRVKVLTYSGLTAHEAKKHGARVLVRGVRNTLDFEKEKELADINLKVMGIPTVFIPADPDTSYVSSSMVRELEHFGFDVRNFIPGEGSGN